MKTVLSPHTLLPHISRYRIASLLLLPMVTAFAQTAAPVDKAQEEVIRLSPFEVRGTRDLGYKAANSISATRIDTPIINLPFSISAINQEFIADTAATSLFDVARYSVGVASAARGFNLGSDSFSIRGFPQAPQHDGFYESERGNSHKHQVRGL